MLKNLKITYLFLFFILCLPLEALSAVTLTVGDGAGDPGSSGNEVVISLDNPDDIVSGVQVDISDAGDFLTITGCSVAGRASDFACSSLERDDGSARVILFSLAAETIPEGSGEIITLEYDVSGDAPSGECRSLEPKDVCIADKDKKPLDYTAVSGEFCFNTRGVTVGCVDNSDPTIIYEFGDTVITSCTLNDDMKRSDTGATSHGLIIGASDITIDGNGFCLDGITPGDCSSPPLRTGILNYPDSEVYNNVTIKNLEIKNFCNGVLISGSGSTRVTGNTVENCKIHDNGNTEVSDLGGISMGRADENTVTRCEIYDNKGVGEALPPGGYGIYLYVGDNNVLNQNYVHDNMGCGIFIRGLPENNEIKYNIAEDNECIGIAMMCINTGGTECEYNYCNHNGGCGILVNGSMMNPSNPNIVRYNICRNTYRTECGFSQGVNRIGYGIAIASNAIGTKICYNVSCDNDEADIVDVTAFGGGSGDCNTCDIVVRWDDDGLTGCRYVCSDKPTADFNTDVTSGPAPLTVDFTDASTAQGDKTITAWEWDFGDCSDIDNTQNPSHTYTKEGVYTVTLTVTDSTECPDPDNECGPDDTGVIRDAKCKKDLITVESSFPMPDLVISEKSEEWINPADPSQGYKVRYTLKNQGGAAAGASTTKLTIDGIEQTTASCDPLDPDVTYSGTFEGPFICSGDSDTIEVCADCTSQVDESDEDNNCKENEWICDIEPDLVISEKSEEWINPADPSQGYKVRYTLKNQGGAAAGASTTKLTIDGIEQTTASCDPLDPDVTYSGTFEGPFICSGDSDTIEVCADCTSQVDESDEDNNCKENEWTCDICKPDMIITEKSEEWIDPADILRGYKVNYTVKNQGGAAAIESTTKLTIDGIEQTTASCDPLDPDATYSGFFEGPFYCSDSSDIIEVCADCTSQVDESDEDNNCKENVWSCSTNIFDIGDGAGKLRGADRKVEVSLTNAVKVVGIQVDICDEGDYLSLPNADDVELTDRLKDPDGNPLFSLDFRDDYQAGCARLILYAEGGSSIAAGDGPIFILHYNVNFGAVEAEHSCIGITSDNLLITDENDNQLTATEYPGSFFIGIYGDLWPYDDVSGTVGDGEVNIFDVVRELQISLEEYIPTPCEFLAGDVPTGFGTCRAPDGKIDVSDVVETVAKILGRANCIDSY